MPDETCMLCGVPVVGDLPCRNPVVLERDGDSETVRSSWQDRPRMHDVRVAARRRLGLA